MSEMTCFARNSLVSYVSQHSRLWTNYLFLGHFFLSHHFIYHKKCILLVISHIRGEIHWVIKVSLGTGRECYEGSVWGLHPPTAVPTLNRAYAVGTFSTLGIFRMFTILSGNPISSKKRSLTFTPPKKETESNSYVYKLWGIFQRLPENIKTKFLFKSQFCITKHTLTSL